MRVSLHPLINRRILKVNQAYGISKIANRTICFKQSLKVADKLIVSSETIIRKFVENRFISDGDLSDGKVVLLRHGANASALTEVRKKPSNLIRFGYIGTFSERKGLIILIEAFNKLADINAELRIYGGTKLDSPRAKSLLEKCKNNPKIRFMGAFKDVGEPYSNIDVIIVPSITFEGYGIVVQEAFATKTPVIASNIGALNESVVHIKNGLLFEVGNSSDLARKMLKIVENPILLRQLESNMPRQVHRTGCKGNRSSL